LYVHRNNEPLESDMFYVVYTPDADLYMNDEGEFGSYEGAARFERLVDANCSLVDGLRVVGPCVEGETP
jgi:hypothetical protein